MSVLDGNLIDGCPIQGFRDPEIARRIRFRVTRIVKVPRISAAHVHDTLHFAVDAVKTALERLNTESQGFIGFPGKQWFVHLDIPTSGIG